MRRIIYLSLAVAAGIILLVACGGGDDKKDDKSAAGSSSNSCPTTAKSSNEKGSVKIGSKPFAEQELLATITKLVLEKNGFKVDFSTKAADPAIDQALRSGAIDMLWQYTGTELQQFLKVDSPPTDLDAAYKMAKEMDAPNGLCWVAPAPLNDTNGLAIKASDKAKYGATLTEFGNYLRTNPNTTVCILSEFRTRADGLPGLIKTYGAGYMGANYKDVGATAEDAIAKGDCAAGQVFTTDSAIASNNLAVLTDDKKLFPPDNVGLIVRANILQKFPSIETLMVPVAAKLTTDEITQLNKQVEIDKKTVDDVAKAWLQKNGFL